MKPNRNKDLSCNMLENIDLSKNAWLRYILYLLLTILDNLEYFLFKTLHLFTPIYRWKPSNKLSLPSALSTTDSSSCIMSVCVAAATHQKNSRRPLISNRRFCFQFIAALDCYIQICNCGGHPKLFINGVCLLRAADRKMLNVSG